MTKRAPNSVVRLHSVPRRFDLATILVVTIAYALLFAGLRSLRFPPFAFVVVVGFISCVGIGQALLLGGKKPRISSVLVGIVCFVGTSVFYAMSSGWAQFDVRFVALGVLWPAISGAISGYVAGVAVGSVFLISSVVRKSIRRSKGR